MVGSFGSLLAQSSSSGGGLSVLLFFVVMGGVFYFLLIRPQQRQRRAQRQLIDSLGVGDEIVTIGGIHGIIRALDDETVTVEVAPEIDLRFARGAISRKLVYDDQDESEQQEEGAGEQS